MKATAAAVGRPAKKRAPTVAEHAFSKAVTHPNMPNRVVNSWATTIRKAQNAPIAATIPSTGTPNAPPACTFPAPKTPTANPLLFHLIHTNGC